MKITKTVFGIWTCCAIMLIILIAKLESRVTQARTFCAYNRVFVEFEEGNKIWGTTMLDSRGRPIPCSESEAVELVNQEITSI